MADPVEKLRTLIDPARISADGEDLDELSWDALSIGRIHPLRRPELAAPLCAVRPTSTDEVRRIVGFANAEKIPIVTFGGGSGLMGGALSIRPSIVLDLREMNRVLEIDTEARSARVQSGIVLEELDKRLNEVGFILGHDPWTLPVAGRRHFDQQRRVPSRNLRLDGRAGSRTRGGAPQRGDSSHAGRFKVIGGYQS